LNTFRKAVEKDKDLLKFNNNSGYFTWRCT